MQLVVITLSLFLICVNAASYKRMIQPPGGCPISDSCTLEDATRVWYEEQLFELQQKENRRNRGRPLEWIKLAMPNGATKSFALTHTSTGGHIDSDLMVKLDLPMDPKMTTRRVTDLCFNAVRSLDLQVADAVKSVNVVAIEEDAATKVWCYFAHQIKKRSDMVHRERNSVTSMLYILKEDHDAQSVVRVDKEIARVEKKIARVQRKIARVEKEQRRLQEPAPLCAIQ